MKKKKVVITGISGFIGSNLAEYLDTDYDIVGFDREPWKDQNDRPFFKQDINDPLTDLHDVYAVIHLAAKAGVRESQDNFEQYVHDNILGTKSILDKCRDWEPSIILVASSSSISGDKERGHFPKSLYAVSKVTTEEILNSYIRNGLLDSDTTTSILIPYTVYGPNQRKGLAIRNFIDAIIREQPITIYGDGTQSRDFTYIEDLCIKIKQMLDEPHSIGQITHLGSRKQYTINQIISMIARITEKPITVNYVPRNRFDVDSTLAPYPCLDKITPIERGLEKQIKWAKNIYNIERLRKNAQNLNKEKKK